MRLLSTSELSRLCEDLDELKEHLVYGLMKVNRYREDEAEKKADKIIEKIKVYRARKPFKVKEIKDESQDNSQEPEVQATDIGVE